MGGGKWRLILALASTILLLNCNYIVLPEDIQDSNASESLGWTALVTGIETTDTGDLHIDLTIHNQTGDWSAMQATPDKPALLVAGNGDSTSCETVNLSTGGHRLAPGFQMRGYTAGTASEPEIQPLFVECEGGEAAAGSTLTLDYSYVTGEYNYYDQEANKVESTLEIDLDSVASDLTYPIAEPVEGLVQPPGTEILAINDVLLTLTDVERTDEGFLFSWQTSNPGEYPSYVHIGIPPVIGSDGIIYGRYETPDLASVPITGAGKTAEWSTEVAVPKDVGGNYMLLSVESKKQRLFVNYAVELAGE